MRAPLALALTLLLASCSSEDCTPQCEGAVCGDDGCGGSCGECPEGQSCRAGTCGSECTPQCEATAECGDDGCGGSCGECGAGTICSGSSCVSCTPLCPSRAECGDDGCGGSCGECAAGQSCESYICTSGDTCDTCASVEVCVAGQCQLQEGCGDVTVNGMCEGGAIYYCEDGVLRTIDCAARGFECAVSPEGFYTCSCPCDEGWDCSPGCSCDQDCHIGEPCVGDGTDLCSCFSFDGDHYCTTYCGQSGEAQCPDSFPCSPYEFEGQTYDVCSPTSSSPCQGETEMGRCDGHTLIYCDGEQVITGLCSQWGYECGLDVDEGYYACLCDCDTDWTCTPGCVCDLECNIGRECDPDGFPFCNCVYFEERAFCTSYCGADGETICPEDYMCQAIPDEDWFLHEVCIPGVCVPECEDRECGDDGCYSSCGSCTGGMTCDEVLGLCI